MTAAEIIAEVVKQDISVSDFAWGDIANPLENIGKWKEVEQEGGEGQGDHWHSVKFFEDHNLYIETTGFYSSGNGTDFYNGYGTEVKPVEKTITVYE